LEKFAQAGLPIDSTDYAEFKNLHAAGIRDAAPTALWDQLHATTVAALDQFTANWSNGSAVPT
jgi:hypothetical protein